jgi:hypothetical protein
MRGRVYMEEKYIITTSTTMTINNLEGKRESIHACTPQLLHVYRAVPRTGLLYGQMALDDA